MIGFDLANITLRCSGWFEFFNAVLQDVLVCFFGSTKSQRFYGLIALELYLRATKAKYLGYHFDGGKIRGPSVMVNTSVTDQS